MKLATKTLEAINRSLEADQGARYREELGKAILECHDAFDPVYDPIPRTHLGASLIGRPCARQLWYTFYWAKYAKHEGRLLRLFNRGHLEEARFIALLRSAGLTTWHDTDDGTGKKHQFRISGHNGHYGGSLDGIGFGCPDLPMGIYCLLEFKTHSKKSFDKLAKVGVEKAKPEHAIQCNQYMGEWKLPFALYAAICKDNDDLHLEILEYDQYLHHSYFDRAGEIINSPEPPPKISESLAWFDCKFCEYKELCFFNGECEHNCRTCKNSCRGEKATWGCLLKGSQLSKQAQYEGCSSWDAKVGL